MSASSPPSELEREFALAAEAYGRSLGARADAAAREAAAREFLDAAARFWDGGAPALALATERLVGPHDVVASRLLLCAPDPEASQRLIAACLGPRPPRLPAKQLALLGLAAPLPVETWALLEDPRRADRPALLRALLRRPTARARALVDETLAHGAPPEAAAAVRAVAGWGDAALLRAWLDAPGEPRFFQLEAALALALGGDVGAVAWLERVAAGEGTLAAEACRPMCHLAWPAAVSAMARHLRGGDRAAAAIALEPVRLLGAMALGPVLLELCERAPELDALTDAGVPLAELAATTLGDLTGAPLPDGLRDLPTAEHGPGAVTAAPREAAAEFFRERLARFDLRLRYWGAPPNRVPVEARPITPALLVDALSDAGNPELAETAGWQLRAMTGEDYGFDPDVDAIANSSAIAAWRARAAVPGAVEPGGWIYRGLPLAPPAIS